MPGELSDHLDERAGALNVGTLVSHLVFLDLPHLGWLKTCPASEHFAPTPPFTGGGPSDHRERRPPPGETACSAEPIRQRVR